jgi:hypothetical protein
MINRCEKVKLVLFSVVVCPEVVFLISLPLLCTVLESKMSNLITGLLISPDKLKYISLVPVTVLGLTLSDFKSILQPEHKNKDFLLQWPMYWALKVGYFGGVFYQTVFAAIGFSVWFGSDGKLTVYFAAALIVSTTGSIVSYWTILLAKAKVQEKLAQVK